MTPKVGLFYKRKNGICKITSVREKTLTYLYVEGFKMGRGYNSPIDYFTQESERISVVEIQFNNWLNS